MKRMFLIFLAGLLVLPGCGEEGKDCGAGTVEQGGECVPLIVDCAPGTRQEGFECVPMCPPDWSIIDCDRWILRLSKRGPNSCDKPVFQRCLPS